MFFFKAYNFYQKTSLRQLIISSFGIYILTQLIVRFSVYGNNADGTEFLYFLSLFAFRTMPTLDVVMSLGLIIVRKFRPYAKICVIFLFYHCTLQLRVQGDIENIKISTDRS